MPVKLQALPQEGSSTEGSVKDSELHGLGCLKMEKEAACLITTVGSRLAYDGRGNAVVRSREELEGAVQQLGGYGQGLYAERWAPFTKVASICSGRFTMSL